MNYKNKDIFDFHSTCSWDILQFSFKKWLDLGLKKLGLPYLARLNFMIYWTWTNLKKLGLPYSTGIDFAINWTLIDEMN